MTSQTIAPPPSMAASVSRTDNANANANSGSKAGLLTPGRLTLLAVLAFVPMMVAFGHNLWLKQHYQFYPVLLAAVAYITFLRFREFPQPLATAGPGQAGGLVVASVVLLALSSLWFSPWMSLTALIMCLLGLTWWLGGMRLLKILAGPLLLLWIAAPPPGGLDELLIGKMQNVAVVTSSQILDRLKITHLIAGNVIELPSKKLLVEEACSGINSLLSVMAFTMCWALWVRRGFFHTIALLLAGGFFVLVLNIIRITLGAVLEFRFQYDILTGWRHETAGIILFGLCLMLVLSADQLLRFPADAFRAWREGLLFGLPLDARLAAQEMGANANDLKLSRQVTQPQAAAVPRGQPWKPTKLAWGLALGFAVLLTLDGALVGRTYARRLMAGDVMSQFAGLKDASTFELPKDLGGWKLLEGEITSIERSQLVGQRSKTWYFRNGSGNGRLQAAVSLDFPFPRWHELLSCYRGNGWNIQTRQVQRLGEIPCVESGMSRPLGVQGQLIWGLVKHDGQWTAPDERKVETNAPNQGMVSRVFQRILKPLEEGFRPDVDTYEPGQPAHYQIQAFLPSAGYGELTPAEQKAFRDLYRAVAMALDSQLRGSSASR